MRYYVIMAAPKRWEPQDAKRFLEKHEFRNIADLKAARTSTKGWRFTADGGRGEKEGVPEPDAFRLPGETGDTKIWQW